MKDDLISRRDAIEDAREAFKRNPTMAIRVMDLIKSMPSAQPEHATCYLDSPCEYQNSKIALPSAQPVAKDTNVPVKDCISRQAAIAMADYTDYTGLAIEDVKRVTDEVVKGLKQLPSAQPEIVRCKDCRWHETDINQCGRQVCAVMYDDDFCSLAERKEGTGK